MVEYCDPAADLLSRSEAKEGVSASSEAAETELQEQLGDSADSLQLPERETDVSKQIPESVCTDDGGDAEADHAADAQPGSTGILS